MNRFETCLVTIYLNHFIWFFFRVDLHQMVNVVPQSELISWINEILKVWLHKRISKGIFQSTQSFDFIGNIPTIETSQKQKRKQLNSTVRRLKNRNKIYIGPIGHLVNWNSSLSKSSSTWRSNFIKLKLPLKIFQGKS